MNRLKKIMAAMTLAVILNTGAGVASATPTIPDLSSRVANVWRNTCGVTSKCARYAYLPTIDCRNLKPTGIVCLNCTGVSKTLKPVQINTATSSLFMPGILKTTYNNFGIIQKEIEDIINQAARKVGISPALLKAVAQAESNGNQGAISPAGAIGVMQLMPGTARALGVNPFNTEQNILGGAQYLKCQLDRFDGNVPKALAAYNAGPGAVEEYNGVPPYAETRAYVARVMLLTGGI